MATTKKPTAIRLTDDGKELLAALATKNGVSQAAIMEIAIRRMAEQEGVKVRKGVKEGSPS
jgi:predicted transcriptional regulator